MNKMMIVSALGLVAAAAGSANADLALDAQYYVDTTVGAGTYTAQATTALLPLQSDNITSYLTGGGAASFNASNIFAGAIGLSLIQISGGHYAGTLTFTDTDGETISGSVDGNFSSGFAFFSGTWTAVTAVANPPSTDDANFNGGTGSFAIAPFVPPPGYNGGVQNLAISVSQGQLHAQLSTVPLPTSAVAGMATLSGLAGIGFIRRRRNAQA